jgi:hypothetical protein
MSRPHVAFAFRSQPEDSWFEHRQREILTAFLRHPFSTRLYFCAPADYVGDLERAIG